MSIHTSGDVDTIITDTVLALAAAQRITFTDLMRDCGMTAGTASRRRNIGGWQASEVARLALRLGYPVSSFYNGLDGRLQPPSGRGSPVTQR